MITQKYWERIKYIAMYELSDTMFLQELVKKALCCQGYKLCDTYKSDWIRAEKKSEICKKASIIVEGNLTTRTVVIEQNNDETEVYMDNGWQVVLKYNPGAKEQIKDIKLVGIPNM